MIPGLGRSHGERLSQPLKYSVSSDGKESACNVGDLGLIPGLGRSPGVGSGNSLQYSCLEIPWIEEQANRSLCSPTMKVKVKSLSRVRLFATPQTVAYHRLQPTGFSIHGIFQARVPEWVAISFPNPGIFPTQGSNQGLPHCRRMLYPLSPSQKST